MSSRRHDINNLLKAIIAEAEVALRRKNFQPNIEHIHCVIDVIEHRMADFRNQQLAEGIQKVAEEAARRKRSRLDELMETADGER